MPINAETPDTISALVSRAIDYRLGDIATLPDKAQSKILEVYTAFYAAYLRILNIKGDSPDMDQVRRGALDPEAVEYMQHFFSDYQIIYREFNALNRHAQALLQTDRGQDPARFQELLQVLLSGTDKFDDGAILDEIIRPPQSDRG
jgi:hypothetical protein